MPRRLARTRKKTVGQQEYRQLACLYDAGIPPQQAIASMAVNQQAGDAIASQVAIKALSKGETLSHALYRARWLNGPQQRLMSVLEQAGQTSYALRRLAHEDEQRQNTLARLNGQLLMPQAIIIIAMTLNLTTSLMRDTQTLISILLFSVMTLTGLFTLTRLLLRLLAEETSAKLQRWHVLRRSAGYQQHYQSYVCTLLSRQLESGIDLASALRNCARLFTKPAIQGPLMHAHRRCRAGATLAQALTQSGAPIQASFTMQLASHENSGTLSSHLGPLLHKDKRTLESQWEHVLAWVPRCYYFAVLTFMLSFAL